MFQQESGFRGTFYERVIFATAVLLLFLAFSGGLQELVRRWMAQEEYSHGFLIPLVAIWLLWERRAEIVANIGRPSWSGLGLFVLATSMLFVGELSALFLLQQTGFLIGLVGLVLAVGGYALLRVVWVPILFLAFAIPLPYFIDSILSWRLQLISSELGVFFLRLFGVPVFLEGNVIDLGAYKLQVVEACSGLRYLYPLMSLGFLAAYLFRAPLWQRATIFLSTIPITILMNSIRISLVGLLVDMWGIGLAEGFLHYFEGWVIFLSCGLIMVGEIWLFTWLSGRKGLLEVMGLPVLRQMNMTAEQKIWPHWPLSSVITVLVATLVVMSFIGDRSEPLLERHRFAAFPKQLGNWETNREYLEPQIEQALGADDYILADFRSAHDQPVNLYVAYYKSQKKGTSPHSPRVCIPGGGWLITEFDRITVDRLEEGQPIPVNRVIIERGDSRQLVYYWFDQRGRRLANEYRNKFYLLRDAIYLNRTDGALVRLVTPVGRGNDVDEADDRLVTFIHVLLGELPSFIPS